MVEYATSAIILDKNLSPAHLNEAWQAYARLGKLLRDFLGRRGIETPQVAFPSDVKEVYVENGVDSAQESSVTGNARAPAHAESVEEYELQPAVTPGSIRRPLGCGDEDQRMQQLKKTTCRTDNYSRSLARSGPGANDAYRSQGRRRSSWRTCRATEFTPEHRRRPVRGRKLSKTRWSRRQRLKRVLRRDFIERLHALVAGKRGVRAVNERQFTSMFLVVLVAVVVGPIVLQREFAKVAEDESIYKKTK